MNTDQISRPVPCRAAPRSLKRFFFNGPPPGPLSVSAERYFPGIEFRPVRNVQELTAAAHLVYNEYLKCGYVRSNRNEWKLSLFQILPTTVTFVAKEINGPILATLTMVEDSPIGLPMDGSFKEELERLRIKGNRLVEFSMFAVDKAIAETWFSATQRFVLICHLIRAVFDYVRTRTAINVQLECCHPKHDGFYKSLEMEPLGQLRHYGGVNGSPAVARYVDLRNSLAGISAAAVRRLFLQDLPLDPTPNPLSFSESDLKTLFCDHANILASASPHKLEYIQSCYPQFDLRSLIGRKDIFSYVIDSISFLNGPDRRPTPEQRP